MSAAAPVGHVGQSVGPEGPAVAIILVNWNGWRDTVECIDSVLGQAHRRWHLYVVDNASSDGSVEHLLAWCRNPVADPAWAHHACVRRWCDQQRPAPVPYRLCESVESAALPPANRGITLIPAGANVGFAAGCNLGVRIARGHGFDFFWFLNNDTVIAGDALTGLLRRACGTPRPGITGSTILYYDSPGVIQALGGARMDVKTGTSRHIGADMPYAEAPADPASVDRAMDYVMGASMLVSREFIDEIGPMREDYFLYFEEIDWAIRGRGRFSLAYAKDSHVLHKAQASGRKVVAFSTRFYYRNRIRFMSRFYPEHLRRAKLDLMAEMLRHMARGRWTHVQLIAATLRDARSLAREARLSGTI